MTKSARILTLAGLISVVTVAPSMADWTPVISVPVDQSATINVVDAGRQFPSLVEALSFRANDTDVMCRDVTAFYRSGNTDKLWRGMLPAGHTKIIYMIPVHRDVVRIGFDCWALNKPGAVDIAADFLGRVITSTYDPMVAQTQR
jgi:hypothetical protein